MQMEGMFHHGVIDDDETYALSERYVNGTSFRKLLAVKTPYPPFHVAREVKFDVSRRGAPIRIRMECLEVRVEEDPAPILVQTGTGLTEAVFRVHRDIIDIGFATH